MLVRECYGCHSKQSGQSKGGLQLDTKQGLLLGGDSGSSLVPGSLEDSPIWSAINYEDYSMPPNKQLSADIIEDFRIWIEALHYLCLLVVFYKILCSHPVDMVFCRLRN